MCCMVGNIALHEWARVGGAHMIGAATVLASSQDLEPVITLFNVLFR